MCWGKQRDTKVSIMEYTENALNVLTAKSYNKVGRAWIVNNITGGEDVNAIVARLNLREEEKEVTTTEFLERRSTYEKILLNRMQPYCSGVVALGDALFPALRANVKKNSDVPVFIYYLGDLSLLQKGNRSVAVIGLLNPTESIEKRECAIVHQLVQDGGIIVSGLANGCDSIAHRETLKAGGKTVAILPSPLSNILPKTNFQLAKQIIENGGLLLSEYGKEPTSNNEGIGRYAERDRLQVFFSNAVLLIASYAKDSASRHEGLVGKLDSGSHYALDAAKEHGIPRFVMYNASVDDTNPMFDLNRDQLDSGATAIESEVDRDSIRQIGV